MIKHLNLLRNSNYIHCRLHIIAYKTETHVRRVGHLNVYFDFILYTSIIFHNQCFDKLIMQHIGLYSFLFKYKKGRKVKKSLVQDIGL